MDRQASLTVSVSGDQIVVLAHWPTEISNGPLMALAQEAYPAGTSGVVLG